MALQEDDKFVHDRVIAAAAEKRLSPFGFRRKGRSRLWYSDNGYWLGVVEFQPSKYSKGSYLNVGACWLWQVKEYFSFDFSPNLSCRVHVPFVQFSSIEQFQSEIDLLACRAAEEAKSLSDQLETIPQVAIRLAESCGTGSWQMFHAAIANGIAGFEETATELFAKVAHKPRDPEWLGLLAEESAVLAAKVSDVSGFRRTIWTRIEESRALRGLPAIDDCFS